MMKDLIDQSVKMHMPVSMRNDYEFLQWHHKTSAFVRKSRAWAIEKLATSVCTFDKILGESTRVEDKLVLKYPPPRNHKNSVFHHRYI